MDGDSMLLLFSDCDHLRRRLSKLLYLHLKLNLKSFSAKQENQIYVKI